MFGHRHGQRVDEHRVHVVELPKTACPELSELAEKQKEIAGQVFGEKEREEYKDPNSSRTWKDHGLLSAGKLCEKYAGQGDKTWRAACPRD